MKCALVQQCGVCLLLGVIVSFLGASSANADPEVDGGAEGDSVFVSAVEATQAGDSNVPNTEPTAVDDQVAFVEYRWVSACTSIDAAPEPGTVLDCGAARSCADPVERLWRLWGRTVDPAGWEPLGSQCFGAPPTAADTPKPQVTPGMVLNALRRIGLPELTARTQPQDKTLVNFATIFYTEPEQFTRTIQLLGQQVDVEATPTQFTWHHGDGTSTTTTSPGAPYPSKEITYSYTDAHTTVSPSVDVTYSARFRVNGGGWQNISETVTIQGPATPLRISEATAVLSGDYQ